MATQSPFQIPTPLLASALLDQELFRLPHSRDDTIAEQQENSRLETGFQEIDEHVLLGGLDRGSVVGISAEEDDFALCVSRPHALLD